MVATTRRRSGARRAHQAERHTDALRRSHRTTQERLTVLAENLLAELPNGAGADRARIALSEFIRAEVIPQAVAEEALARSAGDRSLQLVVRALPGHHRMLEVLLEEIDADRTGVTTAAAVGALVLLCDARWDGEDNALLPALAAAGVDLAPLIR